MKTKRADRSRVVAPARARLVSLAQAAADLGVPRRTLADVVLRGELPHVRIGSSIWLERSDIETWLQSRKERAA